MTAVSRGRRIRTGVPRVIVAVLLCGVAGSVRAQNVQPERPRPDLLGGSDTTAHRQLDLTWSFLGAYDDNLTAETQAAFDPRFRVNGTFGIGDAGLKYKAHGRHSSFAAAASSSARYYPGVQALTAVDSSGNVDFAADTAKARVHASQGFSYQPYYELNFLAGILPAAGQPVRSGDAALTARQSRAYTGNAGLVEQFTPRSALTIDYEYRYTQFPGTSDRLVWQLAHARFEHHLTRDTSLRLGYGYGTGQFGEQSAGVPMVSHDIDIGVDYSRALAFSRHTTVSFASGSTVVRSAEGTLDYRLNGDATLTREIGRTWAMNLAYHRGVQVLEGFTQPVYVDTALLSVGGFVSRRVTLRMSGGYSAGQLAAASDNQRYGTYTAASELRFAINRTLWAYAEYVNYRYDSDGIAVLPFDAPRALFRQGVRVGISGWVPIFRSKG